MKLKVVILLLLSIVLNSCVAVVVAGAAGVVVYDRRSITMMERDARIFYLVHKAIVTDPQFQSSHITVTSFNQVVLLTGQTPKASLRVLAERIAQKTPNVRRVYDEITVGHAASLTQKSKDSWITGQVRTKMLTKKGLESGSIRIVTEQGVVYLMGVATHEQANLAVDVARQVPGVNKVVKIFRYIV